MTKSELPTTGSSGWTRLLGTFTMKVTTTFYRRMVLVERELSPPAPSPGAPKAARIGPVAFPEDLDAVVNFRPGLSKTRVMERAERGDSCFAIRIDGAMAHAGWIATERAWVEYLHRHLLLGRRDIYIYDSYTAPELRQHHLTEARNGYVSEYYRSKGYRRSVGLVAIENKPGLAVVRALGYRSVGSYSSVGLSRWNFVWSKPLVKVELPRMVRRT